MQENRNSFADSYHISSISPQNQLPIASIYESINANNPETVEEHRLSEGKKIMLETFKRSILTMQTNEEAGNEKLSVPLGDSSEGEKEDHRCFQIKEQSNQSEAKSVKQNDYEPNYQQVNIPHPADSKQERTNTLIPLSSRDYLKCTLNDAITRAISLLCKGIVAQKYCLRRYKIQKSILCFSEDFSFMSIRAVHKQQAKVYAMKNFIGVEKGTNSQNFKKYVNSGYNIKHQLCFSLLFESRSFDLMLNSPEDREAVMHEIEVLRESC